MKQDEAKQAARALFEKHCGVMRTADAIAKGIHPRVLYEMRDQGTLELLARGLYRLKDMPPLEAPDLFTVASQVTHGVICLVSALAFHQVTTQIPRAVSIALPKGAERPRLAYPPVKFYWISEPAFSEGIENHTQDGAKVRVYNLEKTIADCFKFRNQIGKDICLEALREWYKRKGADTQKLMHYAKNCRVARVIEPYLEALT